MTSPFHDLCALYTREGISAFDHFFAQFPLENFSWEDVKDAFEALSAECNNSTLDFFGSMVRIIGHAEALRGGVFMAKDLILRQSALGVSLSQNVAEVANDVSLEASEWQRAEHLIFLADLLWSVEPKLASQCVQDAIEWAHKSQQLGDIDGNSVLSEICERLARRGRKDYALEIAQTIDLERRRLRTVENIQKGTYSSWAEDS